MRGRANGTLSPFFLCCAYHPDTYNRGGSRVVAPARVCHNTSVKTTALTIQSLTTDRKIAAIKFIRSLADLIDGPYSHRIGLKDAKMIADKLERGEITFSLHVPTFFADSFRQMARDLGFSFETPQPIRVYLTDYVFSPEQHNDCSPESERVPLDADYNRGDDYIPF
jgi:hypothetical protein